MYDDDVEVLSELENEDNDKSEKQSIVDLSEGIEPNAESIVRKCQKTQEKQDIIESKAKPETKSESMSQYQKRSKNSPSLQKS
jgi:hypothetical protein